MAGSASNWFRPTAGPLAGQAVYISKAQQQQISGRTNLPRSVTLALLNHAGSGGRAQKMQQAANTLRPAASMQPGGQPTRRAQIMGQVAPPAPTPAPAAGPSKQAPGNATPVAQQSGMAVYQAPNGQYGLYNAQGSLIKAYKTQGGAQRALQKAATPAPAPGAAGAAGAASALYSTKPGRLQGNNSVVYSNSTYPVLASAGSLVVIKTPSGHRVINPATGKRVGQVHTTQAGAENAMRQAAATTPDHHATKALDSSGRATRRIQAEGLPNPGSSRNTLDDMFRLHEKLGDAARFARQNDIVASQAGKERGDVFLAAIQQMHGFDALPQKVNQKTLDGMLKQSGEVSRILYRGAGGFEQDYLDGAFYSAGAHGRRMGAGAYAGSSTSLGAGGKNERNRANVKNYIRGGYTGGATPKVIRMGLRSDAKTIGHREVRRKRQKWVNAERAKLSASDPQWRAKSDVLDAFNRDPGYWAAAMGYDAIVSDKKDYNGFTGVVILNRSATIVQDTLDTV
jgi:hypothetical protein